MIANLFTTQQPATFNLIHDILGLRTRFKVFRVTTYRIVAFVPDYRFAPDVLEMDSVS